MSPIPFVDKSVLSQRSVDNKLLFVNQHTLEKKY